MIDIQRIRDEPDKVQASAANKGYEIDIDHIVKLDRTHRELLRTVEQLRAQRNEISSQMKGGKPAPDKIAEAKEIKDKLVASETKLKPVEAELQELLGELPNIARDDVPVGSSEEENVITKEVGEKPVFDFTPKPHWELGEQQDWIDVERAAKIAGSRFAYLKGDLVLLEFAVWQYGLSVLTNPKIIKAIAKDSGLDVSTKPFTPVLPPAMARTETFKATGRLNKEEQTYGLEGDDLWLNASAEHTMAPMYMNEILDEDMLPVRLVGYTTAFRREAGTYGQDTKGIIRGHQFNKLEMESFTLDEDGYKEYQFMIAIQEYLMQQLGLPYRLVTKCTADIGFPNEAGTDIDCWFAGQQRYIETHTADFIGDFQARRMNTRVRRQDGSVEIVNTIDATAFSERPIIAIIENYQLTNGQVAVPKVLQPFLNKEVIGEDNN